MKDRMDALARNARGLADQAQARAGEGAGAVREALGRIGELGQLGGETAQGITDDLNELLPAIRRAGYRVQGIDLDVALPPKIAVHCHLDSEVSAADRESLLASLAGRRVAEGAIRALFQVADLQKNLAAGALKPSDVILELGMSPAVKVRYREKDAGIPA